MATIVIGKRRALEALLNQNQQILQQQELIMQQQQQVAQALVTLTQQGAAMNADTQQKLDKLNGLVGSISTGVDTLVETGQAALKAKDDVIAAQDVKIAELQSELDKDTAEIAADNAEIDSLKNAATTAETEFNTGVDQVTNSAQAVLDHIGSINNPPATGGTPTTGDGGTTPTTDGGSGASGTSTGSGASSTGSGDGGVIEPVPGEGSAPTGP